MIVVYRPLKSSGIPDVARVYVSTAMNSLFVEIFMARRKFATNKVPFLQISSGFAFEVL
jgi:hypothetical protein